MWTPAVSPCDDVQERLTLFVSPRRLRAHRLNVVGQALRTAYRPHARTHTNTHRRTRNLTLTLPLTLTLTLTLTLPLTLTVALADPHSPMTLTLPLLATYVRTLLKFVITPTFIRPLHPRPG